MDVRFTATRFGEGYDMQEVDDFLDRCDRALATGDGSVTAQSVRDMRFTPARFREAYRMDEVDDFLDAVLVLRFVELEAGGPQLGTLAAGTPGSAAEPDHQGDSLPSAPATGADHGDGGRGIHPAEPRPGLLRRLFGGGR